MSPWVLVGAGSLMIITVILLLSYFMPKQHKLRSVYTMVKMTVCYLFFMGVFIIFQGICDQDCVIYAKVHIVLCVNLCFILALGHTMMLHIEAYQDIYVFLVIIIAYTSIIMLDWNTYVWSTGTLVGIHSVVFDYIGVILTSSVAILLCTITKNIERKILIGLLCGIFLNVVSDCCLGFLGSQTLQVLWLGHTVYLVGRLLYDI